MEGWRIKGVGARCPAGDLDMVHRTLNASEVKIGYTVIPQFRIYAPTDASNPHVQAKVDSANTLEEAKTKAEALYASTPSEHHRYISIDAGKRKHWKDPAGKWRSVSN
jgi:hypothetical protein